MNKSRPRSPAPSRVSRTAPCIPSMLARVVRRAAVPLAAAALVGACAQMPKPTEQLAASTAAVETARSAGAAQDAASDLSRAIGKLEAARMRAEEGRHAEARNLAEAAEVDAHVARAKAAAVRSQRALAEVEASMRALREQTGDAAGGVPSTAPARSPQQP